MKPLSLERRIIVAAFATALLIHLSTAAGYGWFRDELYYVACGEHLAFGYVDHPPFVALVARIVRMVSGDSPVPLRAVAALVGASTVALTGLLAERFGARWFGVAVASVAVLVAPLFLSIDGFFSMNVFDLFFCALAAYVAATILLQGGTTRLWVTLGLVVGIGLENKLTIGFLAAGLSLGLVLSPSRALLRTRGPYIATGLALALWMPNLVWQAKSGWMTLEFMNRARLLKNAAFPPGTFLIQQILQMHPITAPIWIFGLGSLLFAKRLRQLRPLGIAYLFVLALFMTSRGKAYYVGPTYPFLLAAGATMLESVLASRIGRAAVLTTVLLAGAVTAPIVVPFLAPETLVRYQRSLGLTPGNAEKGDSAELEQRFADEFGWETLAAAAASARDKLPEDERSDIGIFARNYGDAAAIDVLGPRFGLPHAMSGHNNYWLWGPKGRERGPYLLIGGKEEEHRRYCGQVAALARRTERFAMPSERDLTIYVCREPTGALSEEWPKLKHFD